MLTRKQRIERMMNLRPFRVVENDRLWLFRQALDWTERLWFYTAEGDRDGYWDELFPLLKESIADEKYPVADGSMEPAQGLLFTFLEHLEQVTAPFNSYWNEIGEWYWKDVVGVLPRPILPGKVWFCFEKQDPSPLLLEKGVRFYGENTGGKRIYYSVAEALPVENVRIAHVCSLFYERKKEIQPAGSIGYITALRYQTLSGRREVTGQRMFGGEGGISRALGILVTHPALLLREGKRTVTLLFSSEDPAWIWELSRITELLLRQQEGWSREKILFEIFNSLFYLTISTETGWEVISDYIVVQEKDQLKLQFTLPEDFPSTAPCRQVIHSMETSEPTLRIYPDFDAWLYPYSWLSLIRLQEIVIRTQVERVRNIQVYNELGQIDNAAPFQPFGIHHEKGAWFVLGNYEMAIRNCKRMNIHIQWSGLPPGSTGFQGYYKGYDTPVTNRSFRLSGWYLSDYNWYATGNPERFYLFSTIPAGTDGTPLAAAHLSAGACLRDVKVDRMPPVQQEEEFYEYSIRSRTGFIRFVLEEPDMGFGVKEYYRIFPVRMMENSWKKKNSILPEAPFFPVIEKMTLDYCSEDIIDLRTPAGKKCVRQLYPLGTIAASSFLYLLETDANLLIALQEVKGGELLSLFFHFYPVGKDASHEVVPVIDWYWGNGYDWEEVFPEAVLEDSTFYFMTSGAMKIRLPDTIRPDQYDREGCFWLRAGIRAYPELIPQLISLHVNAVQLVRDIEEDIEEDVLFAPDGLVAEKKLPPFLSFYPLTPFYGEYPKEEGKELEIRVAEYIHHRGAAVQPSDYEEIVLQLFPDIALAYCIPGFDGKGYDPGVVALLIIPVLSETYSPDRPVASSYMLLKVREEMLQHQSPFVKDLVVMNPLYIELLIRCGVHFSPAVSSGVAKAKLKKIIDSWIAPWQVKGEVPDLRYELSLSSLYRSIAELDFVESLLYLTVVQVTDREDGYVLSEYNHEKDQYVTRLPHVVYIPFGEHAIHFEADSVFGIEEMGVETNLVIS